MTACAIDLFCGIGGLTKGLTLAGINVVAGFDNDESCRFAYEENNDASFICKNVEDLLIEDLEQYYPKTCVRILVGCAPCQPFSRYSLRYRKNGQKDNKWSLLYSFQRLVTEAKPEIVSMENVPSLMKEKVFEDFKQNLEGLGYKVNITIAYCPDYGVPQNRKRLVLLASKLGNIRMLPPFYKKSTYKTVRTAIYGLPKIIAGEVCEKDSLHRSSSLSNINLQRIKSSIPGGTWRDWDKKLQLTCHGKNTGKSYPSVYGRMEWDKPSPTITTQFYGYGNGRFGHPEQDRAISLREGAILQSFPDDYIFADKTHPVNKRELGTHIGNAVPVELGRAIGLSIMRHLKEHDINDEKN